MSGRVQVAQTGAWLFSAAMAVFFTGLASAMVVRRGLSEDWGAGMPFPAAIWVSTLLLAGSSLFAGMNRWGLAGVLNGAFLASQAFVWRDAGVRVTDGPAAAFFYLLIALHAAHVAGGVAALGTRAARAAVRIYWHALTALWMVIVCLLLWGQS